jgi:hypothetical protein
MFEEKENDAHVELLPEGNQMVAKEVTPNKVHIKEEQNKIIIGALIVLYVISIILPYGSGSHEDSFIGGGLVVLLIGWLGLFAGVFSWYANPFWFNALSSFKKGDYKSSMTLSCIALVLGSQVFFMFLGKKPMNFGDAGRVVIPGAGYYLWMFVILVTFFLSWVKYSNQGSTKSEEEKEN